MKVRGPGSVLSILALALLTAACATGAASPARTTPKAESCAAAADPTALERLPGSAITEPKVLHHVEPITPRSLYGRAAEATVGAVIGEDGRAHHICIQDGDPQWGQAVAAALVEWIFEPATLDGRPVRILFSLTSRLHP